MKVDRKICEEKTSPFLHLKSMKQSIKICAFFIALGLTIPQAGFAVIVGKKAESAELATIFADPQFANILEQLSQATETPVPQITHDFSLWLSNNKIDLNTQNLPQFLSHYYIFEKAIPERIWAMELNHLKAIAEARFIFDESGIFVRSDPDEILRDPLTNQWTLGTKKGQTWSGSFKTIYRVTLPQVPNPEEYALARVIKDPIPTNFSKDVYRAALNEISIISTITHLSQDQPVPGLLFFKHHQISNNTGRILFLSRFHNRGDAFQRATHHGKIEPEDLLNITAELLEGVRFLHNNQIVHRDIKPSNILIHRGTDNYEAALADFGTAYHEGQPGLAEMLNNDETFRTTHRYAAPEAIEKFALKPYLGDQKVFQQQWKILKKIYSLPPHLQMRWDPSWSDHESDRASDLWSLGVSLLEISTETSLSSMTWTEIKNPMNPSLADFLSVNQAKVDAILRRIRSPWSSHPQLKHMIPLLQCLLRVNPAKRCNIEQALDAFWHGSYLSENEFLQAS